MSARPLGTVRELWRYPVKSMAGEALDAVELGWRGLAGDRRWAFVREGDLSSFPWLSARDLSELVLYRARFLDPADPRGAVEVTTPDGRVHAVASEALAARLSAAAGRPLRPVQSSRGFPDDMPVSVASTTTAAAVDSAAGRQVDPRRFRHNIVIEPLVPERETAWAGAVLALGAGEDAPRLAVAAPAPRCAIIAIDPDTGARDPALLRTVVRAFDNAIGVYANVARPGVVRLGDPVYLHAASPVAAPKAAPSRKAR